eukprot:2540826-Prymnesium_polylepis.2
MPASRSDALGAPQAAPRVLFTLSSPPRHRPAACLHLSAPVCTCLHLSAPVYTYLHPPPPIYNLSTPIYTSGSSTKQACSLEMWNSSFSRFQRRARPDPSPPGPHPAAAPRYTDHSKIS